MRFAVNYVEPSDDNAVQRADAGIIPAAILRGLPKRANFDLEEDADNSAGWHIDSQRDWNQFGKAGFR